MFEAGIRVGVAVSGGVDSLFLLHALHQLAPRWNVHLSVVHIDHGIRGEASRQDAEFVRQAAEQFGLPFHLREASTTEIDDNLEQAARGVQQDSYRQGLIDRRAAPPRSDRALLIRSSRDGLVSFVARLGAGWSERNSAGDARRSGSASTRGQPCRDRSLDAGALDRVAPG